MVVLIFLFLKLLQEISCLLRCSLFGFISCSNRFDNFFNGIPNGSSHVFHLRFISSGGNLTTLSHKSRLLCNRFRQWLINRRHSGFFRLRLNFNHHRRYFFDLLLFFSFLRHVSWCQLGNPRGRKLWVILSIVLLMCTDISR